MPAPVPSGSQVLSLTEYAVLGLAAEGRTHGFAIAREMTAAGAIGRIYAVARPSVYRAVERLLDAGLLKASTDEPGERGPRRTPLRITRDGKRGLDAWLWQPVGHIRDLRTAFLVKLALVDRAGLDAAPLIAAQIETVRPIVASIEEQHRCFAGRDEAVALWRIHAARAALVFLLELGGERGSPPGGQDPPNAD